MLRWCESWKMSPNIGDYVTYGRVLLLNNNNGTMSIQNGGSNGDPFIEISNSGFNPTGFIARVIPGGPFSSLGYSARIKVGTTGSASTLIALDVVNNLSHCSVEFNGFNGVVSISNSTGVIFSSAPGLFPINAQFWVEVKFIIGSGTSGAVYVKLPNTTISLTNINTQNGARAYCDTTEWVVPGGSSSLQVQHQIWWDFSGTYNNDWLGDRRVVGEFPNANGDADQFTPTGLASNYLNAANAPPNGSDYNAAGTVGDVDLYKGLTPSGITGVAGVMVSAIVEKDDSGARSFATQLKSGGVLASGATVAMASSYTIQSDVFETDPATGVPIIPAALPNLQFGGKVAA